MAFLRWSALEGLDMIMTFWTCCCFLRHDFRFWAAFINQQVLVRSPSYVRHDGMAVRLVCGTEAVKVVAQALCLRQNFISWQSAAPVSVSWRRSMSINSTSLTSLISTDKPRGFRPSLLRQGTSDYSHFFFLSVYLSLPVSFSGCMVHKGYTELWVILCR